MSRGEGLIRGNGFSFPLKRENTSFRGIPCCGQDLWLQGRVTESNRKVERVRVINRIIRNGDQDSRFMIRHQLCEDNMRRNVWFKNLRLRLHKMNTGGYVRCDQVTPGENESLSPLMEIVM